VASVPSVFHVKAFLVIFFPAGGLTRELIMASCMRLYAMSYWLHGTSGSAIISVFHFRKRERRAI